MFGVAVGDAAGGFVGAGVAGGGAFPGTTLRVGSGNAGALRLLLLFAFAFAFSFALTVGVKSSTSSGETSGLTAGLAVTVAGGVIASPDGMPASLFPVGVPAGCTG